MNYAEFSDSLMADAPPEGLSEPLAALWLVARDRWSDAHETVRELTRPDYAWVHAYLHHVEGVIWNADYWYRTAGRKRPSCSLQEEWEQIARELLKDVG
ncbi:hypothetical protein [Crenobacter cavernae]|uniref:Uncharacterized protein n=1 Tax=Crenobacter cavernae TaxID=2290923 RepID=A0ABY0FAA1_9NEIS|nr:hypothetical protein [Crenobacter cavernae]RXZ42586.1 hypothetical protein EBB06_11835 [Crenobacter cavernae]